MNKFLCVILGFALLFSACKSKINPQTNDNEAVTASGLLENRYKMLLDYPVDSLAMPRSMNIRSNVIKKVPSRDWTSGFFAGNLWQLYRLTGKNEYKVQAQKWTAFNKKESVNKASHDIGFKVFCTFGEGLKVEDNAAYKKTIITAAETLTSRFNNNVRSIRSWDFNKDIWDFPVIIDNMMNLELLFEATKLSGNKKYHDIAVKHANTTLKNHFRPDNSCYHVVVYDTISGLATKKVTWQGKNDESAWARGQGWAVYGFTMSYRYTMDKKYLDQAEATAKFFINHKNMPKDGIPYWDFNDPNIPDSSRDVSAATVMASALYELYGYTKNKKYLAYANKVIKTLKTNKYILANNVTGPFILDHSTGNYPKNDEINEPIVYADYYFLEALLRQKALK